VAVTFTVVTHSLITTTVPAGATSGELRVSGPRGTGVSDVAFRVRPKRLSAKVEWCMSEQSAAAFAM
jgi:hypothetical protein